MKLDMVVSRLPSSTTLIVRLRIKRTFFARLWLAKRFLKLAARVLGCGIVIEELTQEAQE